MLSYSPIATKVAGVRDPAAPSHETLSRGVWGFLLHTTGGGVTDQAKRERRKPIDVAIEIYIKSQNGSNGYPWGGPAYCIDFDGTIYQIAPDEIMTYHAGSSRHDAQGRTNRDRYIDGSWKTTVPKAAVNAWCAKWQGAAHPYSLFPSRSPNVDFVGCEMIPIGDGFGGTPMGPGLRFTDAQHRAAIALAIDVGTRHSFPAGWAMSSRLLGHEDVDPIERSDAGGGWDPGFLRASPYFDFNYVRAGVASGSK